MCSFYAHPLGANEDIFLGHVESANQNRDQREVKLLCFTLSGRQNKLCAVKFSSILHGLTQYNFSFSWGERTQGFDFRW